MQITIDIAHHQPLSGSFRVEGERDALFDGWLGLLHLLVEAASRPPSTGRPAPPCSKSGDLDA